MGLGCNFYIKNKVKSEICNDKKVYKQKSFSVTQPQFKPQCLFFCFSKNCQNLWKHFGYFDILSKLATVIYSF